MLLVRALIAVMVIWSATQTVDAMPVDDPELGTLRDDIEHAWNQRDMQAMEAGRQAILELESSPESTASQRDLAIYLGAYTRLRQSQLAADRKEQARHYLEDCITALEALLKRRNDDAEARALLGSCYGASSRYYFLGAAWRGLEAGRQISVAVEQAPESAWVVFQDGVSDYEKPMVVGGSKKRAISKLTRAAGLFAASRSPGSAQPVWGEAETWLYIGRAHLALGETEAAREALQTGLAMAPDSRDIREALQALP
jgi:tetratricopeptide (TPR) repeat protein